MARYHQRTIRLKADGERGPSLTVRRAVLDDVIALKEASQSEDNLGVAHGYAAVIADLIVGVSDNHPERDTWTRGSVEWVLHTYDIEELDELGGQAVGSDESDAGKLEPSPLSTAGKSAETAEADSVGGNSDETALSAHRRETIQSGSPSVLPATDAALVTLVSQGLAEQGRTVRLGPVTNVEAAAS